MKTINYLTRHKVGILSTLLVLLAAMLGVDGGFVMAAVEPVELAGEANPSGNMNEYDANTNPEGRPADETLKADEQGMHTQLQGKAATASDARDAGLEAEDYDPEVDNFRKFRFPIETYVARRCRPVKVNSYEYGHWRSGSTDLDAVYTASASVAITAGSASGAYIASKGTLSIDASAFDNPEVLTECSTVCVQGVGGYVKDKDGKEISDGELVLYVLDHKDSSDKIKFKVINPPIHVAGSNPSDDPATSVTIATNTVFHVMASAGSESQMNVAPETYLPEKEVRTLQKKISTVLITDEFEGQDKKVTFKKAQVLANMEYNFKRKCARSHWNGSGRRLDVNVPALNGTREAVYFERGILRQVPMLYTHGADLTDDDLLAISTLMFTNNAMSDNATVFCGKKALQRLIKLVNSADKYKDVGKVEVNEYGIKVRKYMNNFGELEFVWDPTLDDIGYEEYMVALDLSHATRPYKRNDQKTTRDLSKSGEAREAKEYNLCRIDCVCLNGYNAVLVCPSKLALSASNVGGIEASFSSVAALPTGASLDAAAKKKKYYLTADDSTAGFQKGDVVEWDADLDGWVKFEGLIR